LLIPFYLEYDLAQQREWVEGGEVREVWDDQYRSFFHSLYLDGYLFYTQILSYLPLTVIALNKFVRHNINKISNAGLNIIYYTRNSYVIVALNTLLMESLVLFKVKGDWFVFVLLNFVLVIYFLAFLSVSNPSALYNQIPFKWSFRSRELPEDELDMYLAMVIEHIQKRIYRDPELTLQKLAELIQLQPRQLSNLLRRKFDQSFPEFINQLRIEEAKELLLNPKYRHWSILAIGMEVGFNSKSTFNRVFKKMVGLTPSEYQKQNNPMLMD
ncbi:MAG: helix-turn-helix transcriptional regulator, partial [Bacteroidota bacterium]